MGDQGIIYCPECMECECCTEGWHETHGKLDIECHREKKDESCWFSDGWKGWIPHKCEEVDKC